MDSAPLDGKRVCEWFADPVAVAHYARAAATLGLWESEKMVLGAVFLKEDKLLDVGCGAGRVALGLSALGFCAVTGVDFCEPLIEAARLIAAAREAEILFEKGDAIALPFPTACFDGVIFAFNGLMQIPKRENRQKALREMHRVAKPGARLVFTAHDFDRVFRRDPLARAKLEENLRDELAGVDRVLDLPEGKVFMHIPSREEVLEDLRVSGWDHVEDHTRAVLANEPRAVREFADECRFWIARR